MPPPPPTSPPAAPRHVVTPPHHLAGPSAKLPPSWSFVGTHSHHFVVVCTSSCGVMEPPVVLVACKDDVAMTAWDLSSGALLTTYKQNASTRNGLCRVGRDHVAAAQLSKGAMHFWAWHKVRGH